MNTVKTIVFTALISSLGFSASAVASNAERNMMTPTDCHYALNDSHDSLMPMSAVGNSLMSVVGNSFRSAQVAPATKSPAISMESAGVAVLYNNPPAVNEMATDRERYGHYSPNPVHAVSDTPVSTLSIDVDTGAYANIRRFLTAGQLPPVDAVRLEELINYFSYAYPAPQGEHPFSVAIENIDSPWQANAKLVKIGIATKALDRQALPPANLVFLVDVSGSMATSEKLPMVQTTLCLLTKQLRAQDRVSIITYASGTETVLPATSGAKTQTILAAIDKLSAGGATAGESAIRLAYDTAQENYDADGINRILLTTDGDFNVGIADFETLKGLVAQKREHGVALTTLGYGQGNYNEQLMEQLADVGNGNYSYIDSRLEAVKVLQEELSATLATVAKDVKIQVEFNPATVQEYRLIGYENRLLAEEDFNNDQADAGEIGAGHQVTVLYEIIPAGEIGWLPQSRYQPAQTSSGKTNEYAFVNIRYKQPNSAESTLLSMPVGTQSKPLYQANNDTRFAIAVAAYGEKLRNGKYLGTWTWDDIINTAQSALAPNDKLALRPQFVELAKTAKALSQ